MAVRNEPRIPTPAKSTKPSYYPTCPTPFSFLYNNHFHIKDRDLHITLICCEQNEPVLPSRPIKLASRSLALNNSISKISLDMAEFKHGTLNETLRGIDLGCVRQFRGIQYGRIPGRFKRSEMVDGWEGKVLDCTKYG